MNSNNQENEFKLNVKVNCDIEDLKDKLININYINNEAYYKLNIYMIPEEVDILSIKELSNLESYIIIQDLNGSHKKIIHKTSDNTQTGLINDIMSVKALLQKLKYNELMYINYDIYSYNRDDSYILVKNILNQGVFVEGSKEVLDILKEINISYDTSNIYVDNENLALSNLQNNLRKNIDN